MAPAVAAEQGERQSPSLEWRSCRVAPRSFFSFYETNALEAEVWTHLRAEPHGPEVCGRLWLTDHLRSGLQVRRKVANRDPNWTMWHPLPSPPPPPYISVHSVGSKRGFLMTSLSVQWLRLHASTAADRDSILSAKLRTHSTAKRKKKVGEGQAFREDGGKNEPRRVRNLPVVTQHVCPHRSGTRSRSPRPHLHAGCSLRALLF